MSNTETKKIIKEISNLIDTKLFALVFMRLRMLLKELHQWWAISRCEELEALFTQMLRYALGDYEDPDRSRIVAQLQDDLYLLLDDIEDAINAKNSTTYDYQQRRIDNVSPIDFPDVIDYLHQNDAPYTEQKPECLTKAFRAVWLHSRFSTERYNQLMAFFTNAEIESTAQQMLLSALMLKALRVYDSSVINIFIELSRAVEPRLRARAVVALLMILGYYPTRIARDANLTTKLQTLFADESFISDSEKAYKHIINTFGTDKVTRKITTEIYPEIFKSGAKFQQMLQDEGADIITDEEFNPKWEKALMDDEGVSAKLREFGDMQQQGADVYMSTFSSMKGYTFFNNIAHWFMPFDTKQIDVARQMADMPDLLRFFAESTHICSSDKYSFFYSIAQIPTSNFKSMMSGMGADAEAVREDLDSEDWKLNNANLYAVEVRNYVLDLFRFYRLYPRRADFVNPFNTIGKFENAAAPGAVELLRQLKERGYVLALASSKPEAMCHIICDHYGLSPWLDVIAGSPPGLDAEKAEVIRSALERLGIAENDCRRVLMVGDRKYDVLGAAAFGMDCAGAEFFGYAEPGELEEAGAVTVVNTTGELLTFILNR
jgi:phosphoglycolate phosphatase-like HAD superfamily hydrolase